MTRVVVCLPDMPELAHLGELPANVDVVLVPAGPEPMPNLASVDLIVPMLRARAPLVELMARPAGRLKVVQTLSAGVDWLIGRVPTHITVCNARGAFDVPLAEWVVGSILAMQRGIARARDAQAKAEWLQFEPDELAGRRILILGSGSIGNAIAARLAPFDVEVIGIARTARGDIRALDELDDLLPTADVLVSMLPLASSTIGLLDAPRLALLPDNALFVNGGRGRTVDTAALVRELEAGRLRAALDVTDPEPLPPDHPLWALANVLITPHLAGDSPAATVRTFEIAGAQIRRFAAGEPLVNQVERYLLD